MSGIPPFLETEKGGEGTSSGQSRRWNRLQGWLVAGFGTITRRADDVLTGVVDAWLQEVGDAAGGSIEASSPTLQRALQVS